MRRLHAILMMALAAGILWSAVPVDGAARSGQKKYDVFLCLGQSNMAGRGAMTEDDRKILEGVFLMKGDGTIVPAKAPMNIYSTIRKGVKMQGMNPAWEFAREMYKATGRPILIVCNARGGTSMGQWAKGSRKCGSFSEKDGDDEYLWGSSCPVFYDEAVRLARLARRKGELKAVLWHQGEANSGPNIVKYYMPALQKFVENLRTDLRMPDLPFFAGEINHAYSNSVNFNPVIRTIGEHIPNSWWISAEGCGSNPDNLHFSREGQILLGHRYAEKVLETVYDMKQ